MALGLVTRGARALSDHINATYRVFKGIDADNLWIRLPGGGSFEVRHSATNAPVLQVTDAGANVAPVIGDGTITNAKLAPNAVTADKITDGTIMNAEINAAAGIAVSKLAHVGAGNVLRSNGTQNVAGQVVTGDIAPDTILNADIGPTAAIAVTKLAHVGAGNVLKSTGTANVGGQVVDADVAAAAAIALSKLAAGAAGVLKSNGSVISAGNQIGSGDIADGTILDADIHAAANINGAKLLDDSVPSSKIMGGATIPDDSIGASHIIDGSITNAEINAAAGITLGKLLHVGAGNVLRSNGTANVGGPVVNADVDAAAGIAVTKLAHVGAGNVLRSNGTANVAGQVVTGDIAAGAVTQRVQSASFTGSRTATGFADVDSVNGKITLTTTGGDLLVVFNGYAQNATAGVIQLVAIRLDAGLDFAQQAAYSYVNNGSFPMPFCCAYLFTGVSAGAHAVYARHANNSPAGTMQTTGWLVALELRR